MPTPHNRYPPIHSYYNHLDYIHPFYGHHRGAILNEREQVSSSHTTLQQRAVSAGVSDQAMDAILDEEFNAHMFVAKPFPVKASSTAGAYSNSEFGCIDNTKSFQIEMTGEEIISVSIEQFFSKNTKEVLESLSNSPLSPKMDIEDIEKLEIQIPVRDIYEYANQKISTGKNQTVKFLIRWLFTLQNFPYPYPTRKQFVELTRITGLSITQLKYWFINARRRMWKPFLMKYYELSKP